ncbi:hypothetical protein [Sphingomonas hankookensis]|uniref:hypothetical protein n=1 Tax=Sphingomonas hankookensis TaxID=563996 RepID=UPI003D302ADD
MAAWAAILAARAASTRRARRCSAGPTPGFPVELDVRTDRLPQLIMIVKSMRIALGTVIAAR